LVSQLINTIDNNLFQPADMKTIDEMTNMFFGYHIPTNILSSW